MRNDNPRTYLARSFSSADPFHEVGYAGDGDEQEGQEEEKAEGGIGLAGGIRAIARDFEEEQEKAGDYEEDQPERDGHVCGRLVNV